MAFVYQFKLFKTAGIVTSLILINACAISDLAGARSAGERAQATSLSTLYFTKPATVDINASDKNDTKNRGRLFMSEALPLGNGRFGAMFAGGIESEYLVFNEISLWANAVRGLSNVEQSGTRLGAHQHLETVRKAARDSKFGKDSDSVESLGTKYLATKTPLGHYAPFADLRIETGQQRQSVSAYRRELDIANGVGTVRYEIDGVKYTREYFCSYPDDLCMIRMQSDGGVMDLRLTAASAHDKKVISTNGNELRLHGYSPMAQGDDIEFLQTAKVEVNSGGKVASYANELHVTGASEVVIYVTGYTDYLPNYPNFKGRDFLSDTKQTLNRAIAKGYSKIKTDHVADVNALMQRVEFKLNAELSDLPTDKLITQGKPLELYPLYFNYARYLHISSSRNASVPSNLQGLWNTLEKPPWNSDYHTDINIQMNYWLAETTNLSETFEPFVNWTKVVARSGQHTAKETFGVSKGWSIGLNSNVYGFTAQNVHGRRMQQGGHWVTQHLFEHYAFNKDVAYLEDIYPVQKGACEFFAGHVAPWQDGTKLVYPTWSPENYFLLDEFGKYNKQAWGASYDQQLLVNLFTDCIEASTVLNRDVKFREALQKLIPELTPQKINAHGMIQEWPADLDDPKNTHRHLSHLIALHPGRDFSPLTTPTLSAASEKVMMARIKRGEWAAAWRSALWARLRNGEEALSYLDDLVLTQKADNMFNGKPWQIDGNLGAGAAVAEMLLQSHLRSINPNAQNIEEAAFVAYQEDPKKTGQFIAVTPPRTLINAPYILDLLPALPKKWQQGSIRGLKARGGFTVDISWDKGLLTNATIYAKHGGTFRIFANGKLTKEITLEKNGTYIL
ncbi:glycoside hydrolase family 95 protein [Psychrosphaera sp. 1_MG-2023]|uniref:glycoside hydrolase family 95 protein n=1 Tax=Psychrosphaera sp. 1_MG-2023 TaxID=3062643 RepID=UPI0026E1881D|nr:glycoside hydrolase family 95 protein [Psychrosphaera sp. 1_MG-2023]MDO6721352.1 glycoside hydrolase family 95 protein [Psychrosphaera sp. 1_MG-2023]